MTLKVDKDQALKILLSAYKNRKQLRGATADKITKVLTGSHKTYRYVLITALLAKATEERVDVFSLQAQDDSDGAYDARSLCHGVIVKFERDYLAYGLGGSNEPYLNKPARFTRISSTNAVRKGNDTIALNSLISALEQISSKSVAYDYLCHAVYIMELNHIEYEGRFQIVQADIESKEFVQDILDFVSELVEKSFEGEICPIVVSAIENLFLGDNYKVIPHKVNESGASSKEVGDIDVLNQNDEIVYSIEVKDKIFTKEDVEHAIRKFYEADIKRSYFIYGKRIVPTDHVDINQLLGRFGRIGYYCCLINIFDYVKLRLSSIADMELSRFVELLLHYAKVINATNETVNWIKSLYERGSNQTS